MAKVKKIGILSFAKLQSIIMGIIGLIMGILYSFGGLIIDLFTIGFNAGTVLAFTLHLVLPTSCRLAGGLSAR